MRISDESSWSNFYYLHDHLYSPAAMVNSSGSVVERYEYDAYGKRTVLTNSFQQRTYSLYGNDFGLTGREVDDLDFDENDAPRLQRMHYRHRDYSPEMGRFVQQDLRLYRDGLNLYNYARNNALKYTDAYGLSSSGCNDDDPCPLGERGTCVLSAGPIDCYIAYLLKIETDNASPIPPLPGRVDGPGDAFRHCVWSCKMTQALGPETAATIGAVHEVCSPNSSNGEMDNHNNMIGISLGKNPDTNCVNACSDAISDGDVIIMPPDQWRE
ncbi:MAG: hypothetical protein NT030_08575 [Candidatus Saganbacteria bacterium]|nr:hypothetical protein [Candidatus Saganbacteria bacterium]